MISIQLPDGSKREFPGPVTVFDVASSIGTGLAKAALAGRVGQGDSARIVDTSHLIESDTQLAIITDKDSAGLDVIRHSTAHLLAYAVKELFPEAQVTIGPTIENGFFYDFAYKRPFTPDDLIAIEKKMSDLAKKDEKVERRVLPRDEAVAYFKSLGEHYKAEIIESIPADQDVSLYSEGAFTDLCRGPHVPSTGKLKHFKLMKVAGAYWRGDHRNEQLQRIYGTAWATKDDLQKYLTLLEEAEKRDHRKLGRELDLFHIDDHAPGVVFWHPNGWTVWQAVEQYMRQVYRDNGYSEVKGPQILDKTLWEKTGHWDKYRENMFTTESEKRDYALKPMNCPHHVQIYKAQHRSYRDLPVRLAEFGTVYRHEQSGELNGMLRVRGLTQDDAHLFVTPEQVTDEFKATVEMVKFVLASVGLADYRVQLSCRDSKNKSKYVGSDEDWESAQNALRQVLKDKEMSFIECEGEAAFYGPKVDFMVRDCIGREWQLGTVQLDFNLPKRFQLEYIGADNQAHRPVMIHRAPFGSMERFTGVLIEHFAGAFPLWLAPEQLRVMTISDKFEDYAKQVESQFRAAGFRVMSDLRGTKINAKVRDAQLELIPYMLVVGGKDQENNTVSVRDRIDGDLLAAAIEHHL